MAAEWVDSIDEQLHHSADLGDTIHQIEHYLYTLGNSTGLAWGSTSADVYWHRRPILHFVEFFILHAVVYVTYRLSRDYLKNFTQGQKFAKHRVPPSVLDKLLGVCFILCFISQIVFKSLRENPVVQLCWLLMPCHVITLAWAFVCLNSRKTSVQRGLCIFLATMCASCHWGPVGAAAFPDHGDHTWPPYEGWVFDFHHALLCLMPYYWAARYEFTPMSMQWMLHIFTWATYINIGPYTVVSFFMGININYMLAPPVPLQRKVPLIWDTVLYRFFTIAGLIILTILCRSHIGLIGWMIKKVYGVQVKSADSESIEERASVLVGRASNSASRGSTTPNRRRSKKED